MDYFGSHVLKAVNFFIAVDKDSMWTDLAAVFLMHLVHMEVSTQVDLVDLVQSAAKESAAKESAVKESMDLAIMDSGRIIPEQVFPGALEDHIPAKVDILEAFQVLVAIKVLEAIQESEAIRVLVAMASIRAADVCYLNCKLTLSSTWYDSFLLWFMQ